MLPTGSAQEKGFSVFEPGAKLPRGEDISRLWVVIANENQAYIYSRKEDTSLVLIAHARDQAGHPSETIDEHIVTPRMMHDHHEHHHHAADENGNFIHELSEWLELAAKEKSFDQLAVVAPAVTLGHISAALPDHLRGRLCAEVDAELTGMSVTELHERLNTLVP